MRAIYSDINQDTPYDKPLLTDSEVIMQSWQTIISTKKFERIHNLDIGIDVEDDLFELIDNEGAAILYKSVLSALEEQEPRAIVDAAKSNIVADPDNNAYALQIFGRIRGRDDPDGNLELLGSLKL